MAFLTTAITSRFPTTNNQLRTSSNPGNQATIQDVINRNGGIMQQVKQGLSGVTIVREKGIVRQCTQPKRKRNSAWFKEKILLVQAQEAGQVLDEEKLAYLADQGVAESQDTQHTIIHNAAF
ncbi:hypothetical protein Tco_1357235 [Tanacetum coccineum]